MISTRGGEEGISYNAGSGYVAAECDSLDEHVAMQCLELLHHVHNYINTACDEPSTITALYTHIIQLHITCIIIYHTLNTHS